MKKVSTTYEPPKLGSLAAHRVAKAITIPCTYRDNRKGRIAMQQSHTVVLDYKKPESPGAIGFWIHTDERGKETKYVRVICGLALPKDDRQAAALIVLSELFRSFAPPSFNGLAAATGSWPEIKGALAQFCRDLKPGDIICENKDSCKLTWPITDPLAGIVQISSAVAPPHALTEVGRANVDLLIAPDQLHL